MVEIDNTDAEGRLVLADAMTYVSQLKEKPKLMIDVATLTGACRVALGQDIGGMMSNDSSTAKKLQQIGWEVGDYVWELPLFDKYFSSMNSHVADFKNSGDGFAGAITGGLFLQKFSHQIPWVHLDVYCWSDKTSGAHQFPGGYASGVSLLAHYLLGLAKKV
jgi:leucyl aminopeptidase